MDRARFQALVEQALDEIPDRFIRYLDNVEVVIEDEPDAAILCDMGMDPRRDTIYGLYEGTPVSERTVESSLTLPDRITIYFRPLVREFRTPGAIRREVRKTVIHELGHFFGLEDDDLEAEGY